MLKGKSGRLYGKKKKVGMGEEAAELLTDNSCIYMRLSLEKFLPQSFLHSETSLPPSLTAGHP